MTCPVEPGTVPGAAAPESEDASRFPEALWLSEIVKEAVGKHNMVDLITTVKRLMLVEALRQSSGNIAVASELLGISRQGVQQMIQRTELGGWVDRLRRDRRNSATAELRIYAAR